MGIYETLLIIGTLGLAVMTVMGFVHVGHHGGHGHGAGHGLHAHDGGHALDVQHGGGHGHAGTGHAPLAPGHGADGHGPLAHGHGAHGHGVPAHGHADHGHGLHEHHAHGEGAHEGEAQGGTAYLLLGLLSPLTLFSLAFGAGATGTILMSFHFSRLAAALPSALGAWVFYAAILEPLRRFVFSFASPPAQTLEGALLQQAEVVTSFNTRGEGLVRLTVDGQSVDVLARLEEANPGERIVRGQRVLVEDVDTHHNTVRVSRL
jgi:hypothetical protein